MTPAAARREADRLDRVFATTGSAPLASRADALRRHADQVEAGGLAPLDALPIAAGEQAMETLPTETLADTDEEPEPAEAALGLDAEVEARVAEILGRAPHLPRVGQVAIAPGREARLTEDEILAAVARICSEPDSETAEAEAGETAEAIADRINAA